MYWSSSASTFGLFLILSIFELNPFDIVVLSKPYTFRLEGDNSCLMLIELFALRLADDLLFFIALKFYRCNSKFNKEKDNSVY